VALRFDDHEMDVERLCRRPSDRFQYDRPMVMLGMYRPSITSK
jgi:hypothetical protein